MAKDKTAAELEAERRASLTAEERAAEDQAFVTSEANRRAAEEASKTSPAARAAYEAQIRGVMPADNAPKDTAVVIARGRHIFTEPNQVKPWEGGATIMVTAAEAERLRLAGHLALDDGTTPVGGAGPRVFQDAGLIVGNGPGQGQLPDKK